ncbi:MAG TPA: class I SAM-dependent methyltransferase [Bacillota bacterium]|nr:class I SAM-dependent methyltransferase [Bacillota bacterium]HPL53953.1 class I SAM-dependent methyltransferase [Bacillota bacterium]
MKCYNAYENGNMKEILGETLRPGGFSLTDKSVQFCRLEPKDAVLDLGCGMGATVGHLYLRYRIKAVGVDPSEKLIGYAKEKYGFADFVIGTGENIPFSEDSFNCVFSECTLSLMEDTDAALKEIFRVLKRGGWLVISDVYAKNPGLVKGMSGIPFNTSMRGLHDLKYLEEQLKIAGFNIMHFEDCSGLLKSLMAQVVFSYGSMGAFWNKVTDNCEDVCKFQEILKACKPGYFLMITRKGDSDYE